MNKKSQTKESKKTSQTKPPLLPTQRTFSATQGHILSSKISKHTDVFCKRPGRRRALLLERMWVWV
jgi:hypothetical protein